jgi:uncharacterized membrane protein YhaH (DUF805 family)
MFRKPFSFEGRIRRTEYGLSYIFYFVAACIVMTIAELAHLGSYTLFLFIPLLWFLFAQGAKRCHDRGNNAGCQFIPFYALWMLFADGDAYSNEYGEDPKGREVPLQVAEA